MEFVLIILLALLIGCLPLYILYRIVRASNEIQEMNNRLTRIETGLDRIEEKFTSGSQQPREVIATETATEIVPEIPEVSMELPPLPPPPPPFIEPVEAIEPEPTPVRETAASEPKSGRNFEKLVGENLFGKIGILALIIGIGFFVKFAIDNDWIDETGRTIVGVLAGFALWGVAYPLREKYRTFSSVLVGGGFAVCFVTIAVSYNYYSLMSSGLTFGIFVALSALVIGMSLKFDRRELALVAIVGAFVAPFLSVGESESSLMLFAYMAVIDVAMFVVTVRRGWWEISVADCLLSWIVTAIYVFGRGLSPAESGEILGFATLFMVQFSIPLATVLSRNESRSKLFFALVGASVVNSVAYVVCALRVIDAVPLLCHFRGLAPLIASAVYGLVFYKFYRGRADGLLQSLLLWSVIAFSALVVPVQFSNPSVITVGLAFYLLALVICYVTSLRSIFRMAAVVMAVIDWAVLLATNPLSIYSERVVDAAWTFGLSGCCYVGAAALLDAFRGHLVRGGIRPTGMWRRLYPAFLWSGVLMLCGAAYLAVGRMVGPMEAMSAAMAIAMAAMLLVTCLARHSGYLGWLFPSVGAFLFLCWCGGAREVTAVNELFQWAGAAMFVAVMTLQGRRIFGHSKLGGPFRKNGFAIYFAVCGSVFAITALELLLRSAGLARYYSAGFSVGLIVCGAALMAAGMRYRMKSLRLVSLIMFGFLLLKLCVYDVWGLPVVGRIVVLVLLGVVLLAISFLYQKLRKSLF